MRCEGLRLQGLGSSIIPFCKRGTQSLLVSTQPPSHGTRVGHMSYVIGRGGADDEQGSAKKGRGKRERVF
ncbi:unnamed protein product [Arctogadus glacialis]